MATGLELMTAMMGQRYKPVETGYGMGAQAIAGALPSVVSPYASSGQNIASVLGGALVAGLLGYQARKEADERNVLQSRLMSEALAGVTPERRQAIIEQDPRLASTLNMLELQRVSQAREQAAELAKATREAQFDVAKARAKEEGISFGEALKPRVEVAPAEGELTYLGKSREEQLGKLRDSFQRKQIWNQVLESENALKRLAPAVFNEQALTSRDFVVGAVQILEPGLAVREGESEAVKQASGQFGALANKVRNAFDGKGELNLKQKAQIMDIVERAYNARLENFNKTLDAQTKEAATVTRSRTPELQAQLKERIRGGIGTETFNDVVNRMGNIPGAEIPEGFDFASTIRGVAQGTIGQDVIDRMRQQFGAQAQAVTEAAPQPEAIDRPAAAAQMTQAMQDPFIAKQAEMVKDRLRVLGAKGRENLTVDELREVQSYRKMFGLGG